MRGTVNSCDRPFSFEECPVSRTPARRMVLAAVLNLLLAVPACGPSPADKQLEQLMQETRRQYKAARCAGSLGAIFHG